ncbi:helix-turn-helix domain-containing protein [Streptomyces sp. NY05-11A]|uniref:helix-turn-helix domain-containing protein n=1 Tax=Streptomyces soliscabiei TaxID=588897 RepID=UPI0029ACCDAF|nr:helix-turn-helix domain-containing protein [Streptomyces sp. NY05-11A]MDX2681446.1 helix-turn-helix domain-containing protein [Streptomyces sp. NY05-11A]
MPDAPAPDDGSFTGNLLTTATAPAHPRRTHWREARSRTFGAVDMSVPDEVHSGTIRTDPLGPLQVTTVDGDPLEARPTRRLIPQGDEGEYVVVELLDKGVARLEHDARDVGIRPGAVFIYDMASPVRLIPPECFQTKSLVLPRQVLSLSESDLKRITASPLRTDTALGGLLSVLLSRLMDTVGSYRPHARDLLARNVVDLLTVLADEQLGRNPEGTPSGDATMLLRIQTFIGRHLADPDLTPEAIARAHHISVRYLHKLFEGEDTTVGRWIQRRRLEACRRDLAHRESKNVTILAVAHRWGFTSAAHFSRVFRAVYGMSPSEWRDTNRP